jgi:hypothetical protein
LQCLQPWIGADMTQAARDEREILERMNALLESWNQPPLARVAGLFHPSDEHILATFAEMDHYQGRTGARYWGAWSSGFGKPPVWPEGTGKRIYAYLKPFQELPKLLELIKQSGAPAIVYCDGIPLATQERYQAPTIRFENEPLDIHRAAGECDFAILNANHGTAVVMLLAGKPMLLVPIHVEQALLANAIMRLEAALGASPTSAQEIEIQFNRLLTTDLGQAGARRFAAKYATFDPNRQIAAIIERLEELGGAR